eukprot:2812876-Lingulodinium_polyedra.AAC.1
MDKKTIPCYFHSAAQYGQGSGCTKGKDCPFAHGKLISKADFEKAARPASRSASEAKKGQGDGRPPPDGS